MHVAADLRKLGVQSTVGFFLHSPFPPLDIFLKLPWRTALLQGLLQCDLIGLQTLRDRRNLVQCLQFLFKGIKIQGKGQVLTATTSDRQVRIGHFPISIDYNAFVKRAATRAVADQGKELRDRLPEGKMILSVDRLDYTKGILCRLRAFRHALARYPELRGRVSLLQVVVPSRVDVPEYLRLKTAIEELVGAINGEWAQPGDWLPIWYVFGSLSATDLIAYYRAADIALVTPLKDGMNLVAKEYCACTIDDEGVLILSEFAGAAAQLGRSALLVNPYDTEGVADAINRGCRMSDDQRRARMRRLRRSSAGTMSSGGLMRSCARRSQRTLTPLRPPGSCVWLLAPSEISTVSGASTGRYVPPVCTEKSSPRRSGSIRLGSAPLGNKRGVFAGLDLPAPAPPSHPAQDPGSWPS